MNRICKSVHSLWRRIAGSQAPRVESNSEKFQAIPSSVKQAVLNNFLRFIANNSRNNLSAVGNYARVLEGFIYVAKYMPTESEMGLLYKLLEERKLEEGAVNILARYNYCKKFFDSLELDFSQSKLEWVSVIMNLIEHISYFVYIAPEDIMLIQTVFIDYLYFLNEQRLMSYELKKLI